MYVGKITEMTLHDRAFIYRMWNAEDVCIYVGKHIGFHPAARFIQHYYTADWWPEAVRADFYEVPIGTEVQAELDEILESTPIHNKKTGSSSSRGWKLSETDKATIRTLYGEGRGPGHRPGPGELSLAQLGKMYGVSGSAIRYIVGRRK